MRQGGPSEEDGRKSGNRFASASDDAAPPVVVSDGQVRKPSVARSWLSSLVEDLQVAYSTQKQALNALAFFYKDVCEREESDLRVRFRKISPREPVILNPTELDALFEQLAPGYKTPALLQYGAGLRLKELVTLRIKDVDLELGTLTVRQGKGDKDYPLLRRRSAVSRSAPPHSILGGRYCAEAVCDSGAELPEGGTGGADAGGEDVLGERPEKQGGRGVSAGGALEEDAEGG